MIDHAIAAYGRVDVLYNNAGIMPEADHSVVDTDVATWDQVMAVNVRGVFLGCKYAIPRMVEQGSGSIINIASFVALLGCSVPQDAYTASKGALLSLTRSLAVQFGPQGVRTNAICPGPVETPLLMDWLVKDAEAKRIRLARNPTGRFGKPEEITKKTSRRIYDGIAKNSPHRQQLCLSFYCFALSSAAIAQTGRIVFINDRSGSWQLYTINPDGSNLFQVTDLAPTDDDAWFPSISPDGKRIAFNYNTGNGPDLYVVNADGSGLQQLTHDHNSLWPRWSPDGRKLVFTTASDLGTGVIATIAADAAALEECLPVTSGRVRGDFIRRTVSRSFSAARLAAWFRRYGL